MKGCIVRVVEQKSAEKIMLKRLVLGIKAVIQGGRRYERSLRKVGDDDIFVSDKILGRLINGLTAQDEDIS